MKFSKYHLSIDEINDWKRPSQQSMFSGKNRACILIEKANYFKLKLTDAHE